MNFDPVSYLMGASSSSSSSDLSDATAKREHILAPYTAYLSNGRKNTGTIQSVSAATYTPSSIDQTIPAGKYLAGDQTILGDSNLISDNIKKNISIFGITGNYTGEVDTNKTVHFIDYDGAVLYAYTPEDFANLAQFPSNPVHEGLVSQGWNWDILEAKNYVATYGALIIGQQYITESGKTEIDITLEDPYLSPYFIATYNGPAKINWGDGLSSTMTLSGRRPVQHTYSEAGDYTITIEVQSGTVSLVSNGLEVFFSPTSANSKSSIYSSTITAIRLGSNLILDNYALMSCTKLQSITIPKTVTTLGQRAFVDCFSLSTIILPESLSTLGEGTFYECFNLKNVSLSRGITQLPGYTFFKCESLETVTLPNTITSLGTQSFYFCSNLKEIILPSSITTINSEIFGQCSKLEEVILPNSLTTIEQKAFYPCDNLTTITIPEGITLLPSYLFSSCYNLQVINLPSTIETIASNSINNCISLQKITIPISTTSIQNNALSSNYSLSELHFLPSTPPTVSNSNAFSNLPTNCIIYVPEGTLSAYTSATNYPSSSTYTYMEE